MANIELSAKYALTNSLTGASKVLASALNNDSVIIESAGTGDNLQWYFTETNITGRFRLHTMQKRDSTALDIFSYNGLNTIGLHFYNVGDYTGQYWRLDDWGDGTIKLSNNFTGPDMLLDVANDTLKPTLAGGDSPGQHWTLSRFGSASATLASTVAATLASTVAATSQLPTSVASPCASTAVSCTATASALPNKGLSKGGIAGAVVGSVCGLAVVAIVIAIFMKRRSSYQHRPGPMTSNPVLPLHG
ncbi:uncharacterized protein K441DRAFT_623029 [Cenococcum geophilum 1.58]|uniref:Uncharacterized protein n=1 Tax=Cenococcum geophilum 1.58 TaxID=794803 RepID=A0ACC8EMU6_9PEZI|nr:hypothetical protein K441DRAFT_623029 [Cenococcum geophilum 1.58]